MQGNNYHGHEQDRNYCIRARARARMINACAQHLSTSVIIDTRVFSVKNAVNIVNIIVYRYVLISERTLSKDSQGTLTEEEEGGIIEAEISWQVPQH